MQTMTATAASLFADAWQLGHDDEAEGRAPRSPAELINAMQPDDGPDLALHKWAAFKATRTASTATAGR